MKSFDIDSKKVAKKLTGFIYNTVRSKGFKKVILGLSGGLDSTIVAYLSKDALGAKNVIGVIMPYGRSSGRSVRDAQRVARSLKIKTEHIDISHMVDAYFAKINDACHMVRKLKSGTTENRMKLSQSDFLVRRGNKMARERMAVLYDMSKKYSALVIGTSNKTETLLGYGTIYGDCAWALNPIGGLYKTQLRALAVYLGVLGDIITKPPTAGLWDGQTDEDELGYRYEDIDRLLFFMIDKRLKDASLVKKGFDKRFISDIRVKIEKNRFKSEAPAVAKI